MLEKITSHQPVRIGVVGVGYVGSLHAKVYASLPNTQLVAVCDINPQRAAESASQYGGKAHTNVRELIGRVDAVSIAVPTSLHASIATIFLTAGIHVLIEKPITTTLEDADAILKLAAQQQLIVQVGHIERFNAAILEAQRYVTHPRFIEAHRLSAYPNRSTDVSVILDVMIHDLDMVLALVGSQPTRIDAIGVPVLSTSEDIANARLVFPSGCVANLTASRVSDEAMRRIRVFQEDGYLSIDYKQQTVDCAQKMDGRIVRKEFPVKRRPPLDEELAAFVEAVRTGTRPAVSGEEAREALKLALDIERTMRSATPSLAPTAARAARS